MRRRCHWSGSGSGGGSNAVLQLRLWEAFTLQTMKVSQSNSNRMVLSASDGAIIGSTLVYRDTHHRTTTFAKQLAPEVWKVLVTGLSNKVAVNS